MRNVVCLLSVLCISACAFKESPPTREAQQEQDLTSQSVKLDGRLLGVRVLREDGATPVHESSSAQIQAQSTRLGAEWVPAGVISLPTAVERVFFIDLEWADTAAVLKSASVRAFATSGEDLDERKVSARITEIKPKGQAMALRLEVEELQQLFRVDQEQHVFLNLEFRGPDLAAKNVRLLLSTPPSRLTVVERQTIQGGKSEDPKLKPYLLLTSQAETRTLIEHIRLRNDTFRSVRVSVPMRNTATLKARGVRYVVEKAPHPNPHVDHHVLKGKEESFDRPGEFYVYPLVNALPQSWTALNQRDMDQLVLEPGDSVDLGLYASGEVLNALKKIPDSNMETRSYPVGATARCPQDRSVVLPSPGNDNGAWYCDLSTGGRNGWDYPQDTVQLCRELIPAMRACVESGRAGSAACNQAALLDDEVDRRRMPHPNNGIAWPIWMGCSLRSLNSQGRVTFINVGWVWDPVYSPFREGLSMQPVQAEWENGKIPLRVRFDDRDDAVEAQARELQLLPSGLKLKD